MKRFYRNIQPESVEFKSMVVKVLKVANKNTKGNPLEILKDIHNLF